MRPRGFALLLLYVWSPIPKTKTSVRKVKKRTDYRLLAMIDDPLEQTNDVIDVFCLMFGLTRSMKFPRRWAIQMMQGKKSPRHMSSGQCIQMIHI